MMYGKDKGGMGMREMKKEAKAPMRKERKEMAMKATKRMDRKTKRG